MQLLLKIRSEMANSIDSESDLGLHCLHCHFIRNFDVQNFRTFTIVKNNTFLNNIFRLSFLR